MEGLQAPPTAPVSAPKTHPLATWSFVLGIIGCVLCGFLIPAEILAIIFGIIALVKISNSAGMLTGKGKAIAGIIMGGASFILIPFAAIIAAIAIPNLLSSRISANETCAISGLKMLVSTEATWMQQNPAGTDVKTYWTYDVSSFNRWFRADGQTKVNFIDIAFAKADAAPADTNAFDKGKLAEEIMPITPKSGYLYRAMLTDENGDSYNQDKINGINAANKYKFAFVAYPAIYGTNGVRTFIVNEEGTVYAVDTDSEANKIVLQWPGQNPASVDGPIAGRKWAQAEY